MAGVSMARKLVGLEEAAAVQPVRMMTIERKQAMILTFHQHQYLRRSTRTVSSIGSRRGLCRSKSPPNAGVYLLDVLTCITSPHLTSLHFRIHQSHYRLLLNPSFAAVDSSTQNLFPASMQPIKPPPSPLPFSLTRIYVDITKLRHRQTFI
ncbi:hypothetical protein BDN72DRAFT_487838 [Pluteus cervinus]|uniref:Uncharacterized protein n=1 Tax=Pluteus cervinus TaxID=181527 RepID=A0ACD3B0H5_9AGAR|nr:hypothetical protein BDN72DRAFT_487838 [Pluteus cervinus]